MKIILQPICFVEYPLKMRCYLLQQGQYIILFDIIPDRLVAYSRRKQFRDKCRSILSSIKSLTTKMNWKQATLIERPEIELQFSHNGDFFVFSLTLQIENIYRMGTKFKLDNQL